MGRRKVGVLLAGCGVKDGSEIHEATLTLYFLDRAGAEIVCMAPDKEQSDVIDHVSGTPVGERRNVMTEAARIARGDIRDVKTINAEELDAIVIPGGFGAAKNLCSFASEGASCTADKDVAVLLTALHKDKKPIGALCIAPSVVAAVLGKVCAPEVTIGDDKATAAALEAMGARHKNAAVDEIVVDLENKIVTTPCYMLARSIKEVGVGVEKLVAQIMELAG
ncbi:MAG: isoprenoid biosynthesis glyoxalase ElbB [Acidobacteriota bacterium]|nr:isoprenoid biosynthesis glyoxalase ElbB [Acidobacteriota bacterium]